MTTKLWSKQLLQVQPLQYVLASDEALAAELSEGDTVLVNDGMGRTEYRLTGFPTGTTEQGDYTVSATIAKIQESDGIVFYRARVKWPKSTAYFVFNIDEDADIEFYGDGSSTDVHIVASEDGATIDSDAGLTESNSVYRGDYAILPKIEPLPDCTYKMQASGEYITPADTPRVCPKGTAVTMALAKDNKLRYYMVKAVEDARELLARSFTITPTPADAQITYTYSAESNTFTQQNGTVYGYNGEVVTYRIVRSGYKTIEDTFNFSLEAVNTDMPITMQEMAVYYFVYPNGTFNVGDFVHINNGIGENTQEWTANDMSDTDYIGAFTQQGEVTAIDSVTGFLTVEADPPSDNEVTIAASQSDAVISTFGDKDNATVNIVADQDGASIVSSAGLETVTSTIRGYQYCEFEALSGYTAKLEQGGTVKPFGEQFLVVQGEAVSYALMYNNKLVEYKTVNAYNNVIRKRHTVNIIPSEADANVTIYGASTSSIQAYSGQIIEYEVSKTGFDTVSDTYTVPLNNTDNITYSVNVTMRQPGATLKTIYSTTSASGDNANGSRFTVNTAIPSFNNLIIYTRVTTGVGSCQPFYINVGNNCTITFNKNNGHFFIWNGSTGYNKTSLTIGNNTPTFWFKTTLNSTTKVDVDYYKEAEGSPIYDYTEVPSWSTAYHGASVSNIVGGYLSLTANLTANSVFSQYIILVDGVTFFDLQTASASNYTLAEGTQIGELEI